MTNTFTSDDLIRFIYRETSPEEDHLIKLWIQEDADAALSFQQFAEAAQLLDVDDLKPSESSVSIILNYSKTTARQRTHA
ncbi:MAG: hypothetical protein H0W62_03940 [Chitinophagales bacterium]|nr:hypothetical protein [Chitinophagales bacterium]